MKKTDFNLKSILLDVFFAVLGSLIYGVALRMFVDPNQISLGGFSGIGALLHYVWPIIPIGGSVLLMNLPLFLLSWKKLGRKFFFKTLFATVVISLAMDVTAFVPVFIENKLLAAIAGGVCSGIGLGLIFARGMATGGTDLLAKILKGWFRGISYGKVILIMDAVILVTAAAVYRDMWSVLYSAITVWLSSTVIDTILNGMDHAKSVSIITEHKQEVLDSIFRNFDRGATVWKGKGGFTNADKDVILIVLRSYELFQLKRTVKEADPNAFMIISDATEVMGLGFREGPPEE
jgi:uncharacterized membrane-anchored protein YitT (DUF2179 family)